VGSDSGAVAFAARDRFYPMFRDRMQAWRIRRRMAAPAVSREWLAIIGNGRRWRQAHDGVHDSIRIRRGICNHCRLTLTVLPAWCVPGALYNLPARREALGRLAEGETLEASARVCRDPDRIADPSTVRR
jgi:Domain of unknown function (DUF6431)